MIFNDSVMRIFEVRAKKGCAEELEKKLASTSVSVVQGQSGNLGHFFGKKSSSSDHEYIFVSIWQDLAAVKTRFGDDWEQSYLPPGYEDMIEDCSIKHYKFNGMLDSEE